MTATTTPGVRTPAERLIHPFAEFLHQEASGGILLLACSALALVWANSPWSASYANLWHSKLTIGIEGFVLSMTVGHWINDGLMAIFFFVVGLEIKREILVGELASPRQAALPIAAALGGMLFPAAIYTAFNAGTAGAPGWGIPMATDIAFAIGVLALLGPRAPLALKVFLTALAIVDDLGAVVVIALFYTAEIVWTYFAWAAGVWLVLLLVNRLQTRHPLVYGLLGIGLWFCLLQSGIHATIAGVLLALAIPAKARMDCNEFVLHSRAVLDEFERADTGEGTANETQQAAVEALETACEHVQAPLQRLEDGLHPWVSFLIMPLFALANAGVTLGGEVATVLVHPVSLGVMLGLVVGKQIGVISLVWLAVRSKLAALPTGVTWRQIYGASWLAGIGFTMSLFIANLAFTDAFFLSAAKFGILLASMIAGVGGWLLLGNTDRT